MTTFESSLVPPEQRAAAFEPVLDAVVTPLLRACRAGAASLPSAARSWVIVIFLMFSLLLFVCNWKHVTRHTIQCIRCQLCRRHCSGMWTVRICFQLSQTRKHTTLATPLPLTTPSTAARNSRRPHQSSPRGRAACRARRMRCAGAAYALARLSARRQRRRAVVARRGCVVRRYVGCWRRCVAVDASNSSSLDDLRYYVLKNW